MHKLINTMKTLLLFIIIIFSFSLGHTFAGDIPSTATSTLAEEIKNTKDTNPMSNKTGSTLPQSTSTLSVERELCPISLIFGGDTYQQEVLTQLRDHVLAEHEKGRTYTKLYYIHSPEITLIILTDKDIKTHAQKILSDILPIAVARLQKGEASLPQQLLDDTDSLLNEIAHKASPSLKDALRMAKSDIIKKQIFEDLKIKIGQ